MKAYLDQIKIMKSKVSLEIHRTNDKKHKDNGGYCPPKDYPSYDRKISH
jgi:hypothetical protein